MKIPLSGPLRRLDRHWLLNHPILWIMRLHWMIYFWLLGLALICVIASVVPVTFQSATALQTTYFRAASALTVLALSPWVYLQARFAPQLRQSFKPWDAARLLAGYLFIFGIHLAWPYVFTSILELRIASRVGEKEIQQDVRTMGEINEIFSRVDLDDPIMVSPLYIDTWQESARLSSKYLPSGVVAKLSSRRDLFEETWSVVQAVAMVKRVSRSPYSSLLRYYDEWLILSGLIFLPILLVLRIFQATDARGTWATLALGVAVGIALVISTPSILTGNGRAILGTLLLLFVMGGGAALFTSRQNGILLAVGLNVFSLLLAWMPWVLVRTLQGAEYLKDIDGDFMDMGLLSLGVAVLLVATPWIQRRYLALQARPLR